ncbi:hypothetical protein CHARACLAT_025915 [Characodon lateralis]|uniref:Uncharacterized protein n=1 Tax=Characodon lateralis TaxID=208331 RepID=A0ABU7F6J5_9TELE|nr:hypothetical protein [Characodon lateralis]
MASCLSFGLGPAGSHEEQPSHQALSDKSRLQAWLQGGTPAPPYRALRTSHLGLEYFIRPIKNNFDTEM